MKYLPNDENGGYAYIVSTAKDYPACAAIECVDDLSETFQQTRRHRFLYKTGTRCSPSECCLAMTEKYNSMQEGSLAWQLVHDIDESIRDAYHEKLDAMKQRIQNLQQQMNDNILGQLENIQTAESLQKQADDLLLAAAVFKKHAAQLPRKRLWQKKCVWITAAGAAVGAGLGMVAGGVGTPAALPVGMACAEALEMAAGAAVSAAASNYAYFWAKQRWFCGQRLLALDLSRIVGRD